ncbi:hypothetical protein [Roseovarius salis]|uniref:hypothetical protein n=1 Tax=Roseovarius salis TaxID=3376063 RepID=UPI0037CA1675
MHRRLTFLVGAHKTASSHLQHSLAGAASELARQGTAVIGPKAMRADLLPVMNMVRDGMATEVGQGAARAFLQLHAGSARHALLMDENILGGTDRKMLMRKTRLYPWAHRRLGRLMALLPGHEVRIGLAIRNPATFLPSCWSESLHHRPFRSFADYVAGIAPERLRWSDLLERLRAAAPGARFIVWRFEDYRALGPALHAHLLGERMAALVSHADRRLRPGLSDKAAAWLQDHPAPDRDALKTARARFPKTTERDAFAPWAPEAHERMTRAYDRDCARIGDMAGLDLLWP